MLKMKWQLGLFKGVLRYCLEVQGNHHSGTIRASIRCRFERGVYII